MERQAQHMSCRVVPTHRLSKNSMLMVVLFCIPEYWYGSFQSSHLSNLNN